MNWEALGAVGEIVGALSVVLTLIYLARQVRETRKIANAQIEDSITISWGNRVLAMGESRGKADLIGRGMNDFDSLDQADKLIFHTCMDTFVVEFQRQFNHFEEKAWDWKGRTEIENAMVMMLTSPGTAQWWETCKAIYLHYKHLYDLVAQKRNDLPPFSDFPMFSVQKSATDT